MASDGRKQPPWLTPTSMTWRPAAPTEDLKQHDEEEG